MSEPIGRALSEGEVAALQGGGLDMTAARPGEGGLGSATALDVAELMDDVLRVTDAARDLQITESRVRRMLRDRALFGIKDGRGWLIPAVQILDRRPIHGLPRMLRALPDDLQPIEALVWLTTPEADLEVRGRAMSPLEWLRDGGEPGRVEDLAKDL